MISFFSIYFDNHDSNELFRCEFFGYRFIMIIQMCIYTFFIQIISKIHLDDRVTYFSFKIFNDDNDNNEINKFFIQIISKNSLDRYIL